MNELVMLLCVDSCRVISGDYLVSFFVFFFQAEDGIRDKLVTGVQTCALPIWLGLRPVGRRPVGLANSIAVGNK